MYLLSAITQTSSTYSAFTVTTQDLTKGQAQPRSGTPGQDLRDEEARRRLEKGALTY